MVYGINVSGKLANAPQGQVDIWLRIENLAAVTAESQEMIRQMFVERFQPFPASRMDFVIRLKTQQDAEAFVSKLKELLAKQAHPSVMTAAAMA